MATEYYKYFFDYIQGNSTWSSHGVVTSPGFPLPHKTSSSHIYFYEFENFNIDGRIKLVFGDFFLDSINKSVNYCNEEQIYLKIIEGKKSSKYCNFKRPDPHLSTTNQLRLEYHMIGNHRHYGYGVFSMEYSFITKHEAEETQHRLRRGSFVQNTAYEVAGNGHISVNILRHDLEEVDYVWYLRARPGNKLLLNFFDIDISPQGSIEIRDGPTSKSPPLILIHSNQTDYEDTISTQENIYVRWHGEVSRYDTLRFVYSNTVPLDSSGGCPTTYLKCTNGVCISKARQCDGVYNCQKGDDEDPTACADQDSSDCTCENGGTCTVRDNYLICLCPDDFTGERCQYIGRRKHVSAVISRCNCKNGGTCTPTSSGFGFVCNCLPGFGDYDCSQNDSLVRGGASSTEYGIAMGAAVVAVLLVLFGVGLCLCVILQYLKQQREGPDGQYRPALSRDVYSVEAVNIGLNSVEPNDYIPPSYHQCTHHSSRTSMASPDGSMDGTLTPTNPNYQRHICRQQRTPESPPPNYDTILKLARDLSPFYRMFTSKGSLNFSETRSPPTSLRDQDSVPNTGSLNTPSTPCNECFEMRNMPDVKEGT
ncbi:uncharacterized protein LOC117302675 [Asterias rubens]|uniref:uncharacterized protein LOC117302675 n=1 Tax=Asterias rubens TaxID=7604 RepID=UPI00145506E2|nr:uncharacterized protein LOC117302675 [Asterias rubens]